MAPFVFAFAVSFVSLLFSGDLRAAGFVSFVEAKTSSFAADAEMAAPPLRLSLKRPLKKGAKGPDVASLREALTRHGFGVDGMSSGVDPLSFDQGLDEAVRSAQKKWGLVDDGIVADRFLTRMGLSGAEKIGMLKDYKAAIAEIEDAMKAEGQDKWIVVNAATFTLKAFSGGSLAMESRVVVGRPGRKTPLGRMNVVGVKYNPTWTPPPTIMREDLIPSLESGSDWMERHGLVIVGPNGDQVDRSEVSAEDFVSGGYRVYQPAGEDNALGLLKLETDSRSNIYLHDTNQRGLFSKTDRAKSSGCVRVEKWMPLAAWVLDKDEPHVLKAVETKETRIEKARKTPVFVIYNQGDVIDGAPVFQPDVYGLAGKAKVSYLPPAPSFVGVKNTKAPNGQGREKSSKNTNQVEILF